MGDDAPTHPAPTWLVEVLGDDEPLRRVHESLLCVAGGHVGTRGTPEQVRTGHEPLVMVAGVFTDPDADSVPRPLHGPTWFTFDLGRDGRPGEGRTDEGHSSPVTEDERRVLDLLDGVLHRRVDGERWLRSLRFASLDRPGVLAARIARPLPVGDDDPLVVPDASGEPERRTEEEGVDWVVHRGAGGITAAVATDHRTVDDVHVADRIAVVRGDPHGAPDPDDVRRSLADARRRGVDGLLDDHRRAWHRRWANAAVRIDGDPELERAVRFGLFHLIGSVADGGEAAVGARGLTGEAYAGHVFWDADVFVLPVLAATHAPAARAMLEYRLQRLAPARARAAAEGRDGARFPWESAADGREATPRTAEMPNGEVWPVRTGDQEEHIVADVAWAAWCHDRWSGTGFAAGDGRPLLVEAAAYWASRVELGPDGRGHIRGVIGPDEYHESVDDNAYTNVMARWCLRRGAALLDDDRRAASWRALAARIVDGRRPDGVSTEQFDGYDELAPVLAEELGTPPLAADLLLGRERLAETQIVKQPDVLMLHHLVPDEMPPRSLPADLDHYLPRTAHGSSLSPAIHASLLGRAGRPQQALDLLRLAATLDLADRTGTTGGGLHLATMGGVWQALAFGLLGLSPRPDLLRVDPAPLPAEWQELEVRVVFHGTPLAVRCSHDRLAVEGPDAVRVALRSDGAPRRPPVRWRRNRHGSWEEDHDG